VVSFAENDGRRPVNQLPLGCEVAIVTRPTVQMNPFVWRCQVRSHLALPKLELLTERNSAQRFSQFSNDEQTRFQSQQFSHVISGEWSEARTECNPVGPPKLWRRKLCHNPQRWIHASPQGSRVFVIRFSTTEVTEGTEKGWLGEFKSKIGEDASQARSRSDDNIPFPCLRCLLWLKIGTNDCGWSPLSGCLSACGRIWRTRPTALRGVLHR